MTAKPTPRFLGVQKLHMVYGWTDVSDLVSLKLVHTMRLVINNYFQISLIGKLPPWFQHNSTKKSCDANRIV